jgi:hypothetical protein
MAAAATKIRDTHTKAWSVEQTCILSFFANTIAARGKI